MSSSCFWSATARSPSVVKFSAPESICSRFCRIPHRWSWEGSFRTGISVSNHSGRARNVRPLSGMLPVDPWAPSMESQSVAPQLFASSLFPYIGFLYFITKSKTAPKLTLFGFYFLLVFVGATIPAGIYAKVQFGTSLSNVDWLHGGAESLLTLTNLFIVLGLMDGLRKTKSEEDMDSGVEKEKESSI
ncbi:1-acyl-sn-glycerol-3-phosphate acyltransferase isoform X2 [Wolffia australiana]